MMIAAQHSSAADATMSVLVLEGSADYARQAGQRLRSLGYDSVTMAATAQDARAALAAGRYGFALIDVRSAGAELDSVVRALEMQEIPFVFVADRMAGEAQNDRYSWTRIMAKPYGEAELAEAIEAAMASQDLTLTL